ncbi:chemotaxis protein CheY [Vibrio lentus]|nr:chemotaxis protein CheY [Vibrio lentus]
MTLSPDLRVLIVDDSKSATILIKQQLVGLGIPHRNVFIATNYQQAIKAVESHSFHVLLIDYHLEQSFTGFELLGILYRNRLIDHTVAIILLSGDMRQETVLTALSGEAHHFISKPINTLALGKKIQTAVFEAKQISQLTNLYQINNQVALNSALNIPGKDTKVQFEATLIEHLIARKKWELLSYLLNKSGTNMHPTKLVAEALILDGLGKPKSAIDKLHNYLVAQPLSLNVIDCLSCIYEKHQMLIPALKLAIRAFELTPSISHRAIRAIDLAENVDNTQVLIKLGEIYANSISLADLDVIHSISTYFNALRATYEREMHVTNKKLLIEHAGQFTTQVNLKLPNHSQNQILSNLAIFHCHILIFEKNEKLAHHKLVKATTLLSHRFYDGPTDLLNQLLPLLDHFGEYSMYRAVTKCILSRGDPVLHQIQPATLSPSTLINLESVDSVNDLKNYIHNYPYSVAAKLDYLYAVNKTQIQEQLSDDFVQEITQLELPEKWKTWVSDLSLKGFITKPPCPFPTISRRESIC